MSTSTRSLNCSLGRSSIVGVRSQRPAWPPGRLEGAAGALGAAEGGRAADGLAAHGAGGGAVEHRGAPGGGRRDVGMAFWS